MCICRLPGTASSMVHCFRPATRIGGCVTSSRSTAYVLFYIYYFLFYIIYLFIIIFHSPIIVVLFAGHRVLGAARMALGS